MNAVQTKTQVISTPAGMIIKLPDSFIDGERAWKRAEKKHGVSFRGFGNGSGAEEGSEALRRHRERTMRTVRQQGAGNPTPEITRRKQSRAAQLLNARVSKDYKGRWIVSTPAERALLKIALHG